MKILFSPLALLLVLACHQGYHSVSGEIYFKNGAPHVQLGKSAVLSGAVKNSREGRPYSAFIGVEYAKIKERFQPSELIKDPKWDGVKEVIHGGPECAQNNYGEVEGMIGQEDCLTLNVYVPMNNSGNGAYPVMIWVHGGGLTYGAGLYYGEKFFMDEDVLLVTVNYRLGVFGFLSTGDEVISGNAGLKDQATSFRWVQENIKKFGGDPSRVTIFGESGGGLAVHYQFLSPTTDGLFHRAISQSAAALDMFGFQPKPRENAVKLATYLKCPTGSGKAEDITSQEIRDCLVKLSMEELSAAQRYYIPSWPKGFRSFNFMPTVEPKGGPESTHKPFLTETPYDILSNPDKPLKNIPWYIGATEDEGATTWSGAVTIDPKMMEELDKQWETVAPKAIDWGSTYISCPKESNEISKKVRKFYFGEEPVSLKTRQKITDLYSDQMFMHGIYKSALFTAARSKTPVYFYEYAYPGPVCVFNAFYDIGDVEKKQVGHGDELQHLFDMTDLLGSTGTAESNTFSQNLIRLWASIGKHGKPVSTWGPAKWNPISKEEVEGKIPLRWYRIKSTPSIVEFPHTKRMNFWDQIWKDHVIPALQKRGSGSSGHTEL